ncbi:cupin domain-containing protein [Candidatus Woesearchaeota archaeon]|nr:cupin domain-containing protein [Candidatus Woesearchaeota archaeon]
MKARIIRAFELKEKEFGSTKVTDILNEEDWPFFSVAKVVKVGDDIREGIDKESNVAYYVLDGEGVCWIDGRKEFLKKGDCIIYPKGTKYKHMKGLTLLAISSPRFDRNKRKYTE